MTINKLERVMWRLRVNNPNIDKVLNKQLRMAIMKECGTDQRTYARNREALIKLGWIKTRGNKWVILTNQDLTE